MKQAAVVLVAAGLAIQLSAVLAQDTKSDSAAPRFEIARFVVEGNTLLKPEKIEQLIKPFRGQKKDFSDVQRALEALQQAYQELGYGAVQVTLPEQELEQGEVKFVVIEARIGKVEVQGNEHHDTANIRDSLPALREGTPPNSREVAGNLKAANENPSKQTTVLLKSTETEGIVDAAVKVSDEKPRKILLTFDNSGNQQTGIFRAGAAIQHANLLNRDHVMTVQYITSPGHATDVTILGAGYRIPLYRWGGTVDAVAGYSDVDSGTLQNVGIAVSGRGTVFGLRYNQFLDKVGDNYEHKLSYGLDYRAYQTRAAIGGSVIGGANGDVTAHPVSVTYSGNWRLPAGEVSLYAGAAQNILPNGNDAADSDFKAMRAGAKASYRVYRYGANYSRAFASDWQLRLAYSGQDTPDALISGEQFGLGGADSVRGFLEREISSDRGNRGGIELYSPDFAARMGMKNSRSRLLAFYDFGDISQVGAAGSTAPAQSVSSIGFGWRYTFGANASARVDFAQVNDGGGSQGDRDQKIHASFAYVF